MLWFLLTIEIAKQADAERPCEEFRLPREQKKAHADNLGGDTPSAACCCHSRLLEVFIESLINHSLPSEPLDNRNTPLAQLVLP